MGDRCNKQQPFNQGKPPARVEDAGVALELQRRDRCQSDADEMGDQKRHQNQSGASEENAADHGDRWLLIHARSVASSS